MRGPPVRAYWVYILASQPRGTLHIGVTNGMIKRVDEHRAGLGSKFTAKYKVHRLVWYEEFTFHHRSHPARENNDARCARLENQPDRA